MAAHAVPALLADSGDSDVACDPQGGGDDDTHRGWPAGPGMGVVYPLLGRVDGAEGVDGEQGSPAPIVPAPATVRPSTLARLIRRSSAQARRRGDRPVRAMTHTIDPYRTDVMAHRPVSN